MILYSVTVTLEAAIHREWFDYMKTKHIPEVLATGCFTGFNMYRILSTQEESEISYNIQYQCLNHAIFTEYQNLHAKRLQKDHTDLFGNQALAFRTLLEAV